MLDTKTFPPMLVTWFMIYFLCNRLVRFLLARPAIQARLPDSKTRAALAQQAHAYLVSTIHACYVFPRGYYHLTRLFRGPLLFKLVCPRVGQTVELWQLPFANEIDRVMWTNLVLAGYLSVDLFHVLAAYPTLGGLDTVSHHVAFLLCALIAGWYRLYPFMFGWLILGEASTPLLNLRWFLIKTGNGSTTFFRVVELSFALVFLCGRFFLYGAGLAYQIPMLSHMPDDVPLWATVVTMGTVVSGFVINILWLRKIWRLAMGTSRREHAAVASDATARSRPAGEKGE